MELVPGEPLSSIIEREKTLSTDRVLDIVGQTAAALQAAHAAGLVHRDIKPGNMLITPEGRVKITDFGIARIADQVPLTATGQVMGTVQYLSPEQASGHAASPSTDVYSLGIVAYECLTGKRPFSGESQVAIAMSHINDAPPALPDTIAEPVRNLVMSCIAKRPGARPASSAHLARACQALRRGDVQGAAAAVPEILGGLAPDDATMVMPRTAETGATTVLSIPESGENIPHPKKRNPWTWPLIALGGVLVLVLVGSLIALFTGGGPQPTPTTSGPPSRSTPTATPTQKPTKTPTPTPTAAAIPTDLVGKNVDAAEAQLKAAGWKTITRESIGVAHYSEDVFTVSYVSATGVTPFSDPITLKFYENTPALNTPGVAVLTGGGPVTTGTLFVVSWTAYTCPVSFNVVSYTVTFNGAAISPVNPPGVTTVTLTAPPTPGTYNMTYVVKCDGVNSPAASSLPIIVN
jgi:serine/threonine-protein kinase